MGKVLKLILLVIFVLAVIIFTVQNFQTVRLSFLKWHLEMPLSLASVLLYVLGAVSGGLMLSMIKKLYNKDSSDKHF